MSGADRLHEDGQDLNIQDLRSRAKFNKSREYTNLIKKIQILKLFYFRFCHFPAPRPMK